MEPADQYQQIRQANTCAANYDLDTDTIVARLKQWEPLCKFRVTGAGYDTVNIEFETLPGDMDAFVRELYDFCPDLIDQGTGCVQEYVESMEEEGQEIAPRLKKLIEGIDFEDEDYGLEILKREILEGRTLVLWWD